MRCALLALVLFLAGPVAPVFSRDLSFKDFWKPFCHVDAGETGHPKVACPERYVESISVGAEHTCALVSSGGYECVGPDSWLNNTEQKPRDGSTFVQVSAGDTHTCGLTWNGRVECIGEFNGRVPQSVAKYTYADGSKRYMQISAGPSDVCALTENGAYSCTGQTKWKTKWEIPKAKGNYKYTQVSLGYFHACALTSDGRFECALKNQKSPVPTYAPRDSQLPRDGSQYVQVSCGEDYTCALSSNGWFKCWGNDNLPSDMQMPKDGSKYVQISAGQDHTCALTSNGGYDCIGNNAELQAPKELQSPKDDAAKYVEVSTSRFHTCGLTSNGQYECVGRNDKGQAPLNNRPTSGAFGASVPTQILAFVSAGDQHTCALSTRGELQCVGLNKYGQAPKGLVRPLDGSRYVQVSAGGFHTCALTSTGRYECRGLNTETQAPKTSRKDKIYAQVSCGYINTCTLEKDGLLECFGWSKKESWSKNAKEGKFVHVSSGPSFVCALTDIGAIECFGSKGVSKNGPTGQKYTQVSVGIEHVCALTRGENIECYGKLGGRPVNDALDELKRETQGTAHKQVIARQDHICSLNAKGEYKCVGTNVNTQLQTPKNGTMYVQLTAGGSRTCGLNSIGGYVCVGAVKDDTIISRNRHCPVASEENVGICTLCRPGEISVGGDGKCEQCSGGSKPSWERDRCIFPFIEAEIKRIKEEQNDLSFKNGRLWQRENIRMKHDKLMTKRSERDGQSEHDFCRNEKEDRVVVFPAVDVTNEIEDVEDTTCIDTNRDEMLKAFCNFRMDLDGLLQIKGIKQNAASFFPNICCKERRGSILGACEDPTGKTKREDIIPFALSQGGRYSWHNLYAEVSDTLKKDGYLHSGMMEVLEALKDQMKDEEADGLKSRINAFFKEVSLCGPRIVKEPGTHGERQLCQLFFPYSHVLVHFYNALEGLWSPADSFLEEGGTARLGKAMRRRQWNAMPFTRKTPLKNTMLQKQMRGTNPPNQQCLKGSKFKVSKLPVMKRMFCRGINHIDTTNPTIKNVALYYLEPDLKHTDKGMLHLKHSLRYEVKDAQKCPSKLFGAEDISIQHVEMNGHGSKKGWAAVIKLNTNEGGYLKSEMPKCNTENYLPSNELTVKVYQDEYGDSCCKGSKDFEKCEKTNRCKLKELKDRGGLHFSKIVEVTGTVCTVENPRARRRRLLGARSGANNCRL